MSDFTKMMKTALQSSVKFIVRTAKSAAQSAKYKMNEMSTMSKRRELINDLGEKVYALACQGNVLPEALNTAISQISALDENLTALRANHAAQKATAAQKVAEEKAERAAKKAAQQVKPAGLEVSESVNTEAVASEKEEVAAPVLEFNSDTSDEACNESKDTPNLNV